MLLNKKNNSDLFKLMTSSGAKKLITDKLSGDNYEMGCSNQI
jgi:hypothetical protein